MRFPSIHTAFTWLSACLLFSLWTACSDNTHSNEMDSDLPETRQLSIVSPPGQDVGLRPGGTVTLRVRYHDTQQIPISGHTVSFALLGETGGATLTAPERVTDEEGLAPITLNAGFEEAFFHIEATAPNAAPVRYSVAVSNAGFGALSAGVFENTTLTDTPLADVAFRLYLSFQCGQLDPFEPGTPHKSRWNTMLSERANFGFLPLDVKHAVSVTGYDENEEPLFWGCTDISIGVLREGVTLSTDIPAQLLLIEPAEAYIVRSNMDLEGATTPALSDAVRPWVDMGNCPLGPAQTLLDCLVAAIDDPNADPGELLCGEPPASTLAVEIDSLRGTLNGRCRTETNLNDMESLEQKLQQHGADPEQIARLHQLAEDGTADLFQLQLISYLSLYKHPSGNYTAGHELWQVTFPKLFEQPSIAADQVLLPRALAADIAVARNTESPQRLEVSAHGLTLRPTRFVLLALNEVFLASAHVGSTLEALQELWQPEQLGVEHACHNIDELVCGALRRPDGCVLQACELAMRALATDLRSGLVSLEAQRVDLELDAASVLMKDTDKNFEAEMLGTESAPGQWSATLWLGAEQPPLSLDIQFLGYAPVNPIR
jgi:hypothetical protein